MRKRNSMTLDGKNLVIESVIVGQPSKDVLKNVGMIIAQSYLNRGGYNG